MSVYSLRSRDQDLSKQKVKTIDFQTICFSMDYAIIQLSWQNESFYYDDFNSRFCLNIT